jgi:hypothetical protein
MCKWRISVRRPHSLVLSRKVNTPQGLRPPQGVEAADIIGALTDVWDPECGVIGPRCGATSRALERTDRDGNRTKEVVAAPYGCERIAGPLRDGRACRSGETACGLRGRFGPGAAHAPPPASARRWHGMRELRSGGRLTLSSTLSICDL